MFVFVVFQVGPWARPLRGNLGKTRPCGLQADKARSLLSCQNRVIPESGPRGSLPCLLFSENRASDDCPLGASQGSARDLAIPPLPAVTGQEEGDLERRRGGWGRKRLGLEEEKVDVKGVQKGTWEGPAFVLRDLGVLEHNPGEQNGGYLLWPGGSWEKWQVPPTPTGLTHHVLPGKCPVRSKERSPPDLPMLPICLPSSPAPLPLFRPHCDPPVTRPSGL